MLFKSLIIISTIFTCHAFAGIKESPRSDSRKNSVETYKERKVATSKPLHPAYRTNKYKDDKAKANSSFTSNKKVIKNSTRSDMEKLSKSIKNRKK